MSRSASDLGPWAGPRCSAHRVRTTGQGPRRPSVPSADPSRGRQHRSAGARDGVRVAHLHPSRSAAAGRARPMTTGSPRSVPTPALYVDRGATWAGDPSAALATLRSSERGLSDDEAARRLETFGASALRPPRRESAATLLLRQFRSPLIYIPLVAGLISLALGELIDAGAIAAVLVFNAAIGFTQELQATRELEALPLLTPDRATVVRDGGERTIESRELAPGDVVLLDSGARVPADARVLHAAALEADESLLTGESVPVSNSARAAAPEAAPTARPNMLIAGTVVTRGRARARRLHGRGDRARPHRGERDRGSRGGDPAAAPHGRPRAHDRRGRARDLGARLRGRHRSGREPRRSAAHARRAGRVGDPGGAADRADDHARGGCATDGRTPRADPPLAGRRDAGQLHHHRLGRPGPSRRTA